MRTTYLQGNLNIHKLTQYLKHGYKGKCWVSLKAITRTTTRRSYGWVREVWNDVKQVHLQSKKGLLFFLLFLSVADTSKTKQELHWNTHYYVHTHTTCAWWSATRNPFTIYSAYNYACECIIQSTQPTVSKVTCTLYVSVGQKVPFKNSIESW